MGAWQNAWWYGPRALLATLVREERVTNKMPTEESKPERTCFEFHLGKLGNQSDIVDFDDKVQRLVYTGSRFIVISTPAFPHHDRVVRAIQHELGKKVYRNAFSRMVDQWCSKHALLSVGRAQNAGYDITVHNLPSELKIVFDPSPHALSQNSIQENENE